MEDQKQPKTATQDDLPAELIERFVAADAVLFVSITDDGQLATARALKYPPFQPGHDASHAYLQAIELLNKDILAKVTGDLTDGDRYRALRAFSNLAKVNPVQFEVVNEMLQQFEERVLPTEDKRTAADYDKMADFLAHAILETTPAMTAPTTEPDAPAITLDTK